MTRKLFLLTLIPLVLAGCRSSVDPAPAATYQPPPQNVILFIGDGMGATHFTVLHQLRGAESTLPRFSTSALVTTHSASSLVTDSGAAASAMAAGVKTINAALSVTPAGEKVETVLEIAEKSGKKTGLVSTTRFWDATPAAFASHVSDRKSEEAIIEQMLSSGVDLVISNGAQHLGIEGKPTMTELADEFGFTPVSTVDGLVPMQGPVLAMFTGPGSDRDHPDAPLPVLTRYAIEQLADDPDGFFLMIESEGTDTTSHRHETQDLLDSLRSFDEAVSLALDFAEENGNTLVLMVGDHETGAFQIEPPEKDGEMKLSWFSGHHTGQALPLLAYGPGANRFTGWIDNTDIGKWLKEAVEGPSSVLSPQSTDARKQSTGR